MEISPSETDCIDHDNLLNFVKILYFGRLNSSFVLSMFFVLMENKVAGSVGGKVKRKPESLDMLNTSFLDGHFRPSAVFVKSS